MTALSARELRIAEFVGGYTEAQGEAPTARQISERFALGGKTAAQRIVERLRRSGLIARPAPKVKCRPQSALPVPSAD